MNNTGYQLATKARPDERCIPILSTFHTPCHFPCCYDFLNKKVIICVRPYELELGRELLLTHLAEAKQRCWETVNHA